MTLIGFFVPSAPYNAAQIIPSFSYFDATRTNITRLIFLKSAVVKEVSKGKRGVNFNLSKALEKDQVEKFFNTYGYSPKLPEIRGIDSIRFLSKVLNGRELSGVNSREDYVSSLLVDDEIDLSSSVFRLVDGVWNLDFELGHFSSRVVSGLRFVEKLKLLQKLIVMRKEVAWRLLLFLLR